MAKTIALDSVIIIYLLEDHPQYRKKVQEILNAVQRGKNHAVMSVVGMIEILTGPKRLGRYDIAGQYKQFLSHFPNLSIIGIGERVVDTASDFRARYGIRTPDAIHVATALVSGADVFITNDRDLQKVKEIPVQVIGE